MIAMSPSRARTADFFSPLESLRGLAALAVVVYHAVWTNPVSSLNFFQNGPLMVDFFFVLSGFVIFHSYGNKLGTGVEIGKFLWLRLGRLYPLHVAFLLVFLGIEVMKLLAEMRLGLVDDKPAFTVNNGYAFLTNLLLLHSLGFNSAPTYNYPSWSISTEFYAYVLFAATRWTFNTTLGFAIAAVTIVAVGSGILLWLHIVPLSSAGVAWGFLRCCAGFFLGTLTYLGYARLRTATGGYSWPSVVALSALITVLSVIDPNGVWTYSVPLLSCVVILSITVRPGVTLNGLLSCRPLAWLGRVSYSVYMVHAALVWVITQILTVGLKYPKTVVADGHGVATPPVMGLIVLVVYIGAVLLVSHFTYQWIEEPLRNRSRRISGLWFPRAAEPASPSV
jgi:peptidoglycan/LPS O-acetylase OafA/YrhL